MAITRDIFGSFRGRQVERFAIQNANGIKACVMNWGAVMTSLEVEIGGGQVRNVVLGLRDFDDYPEKSPYFGATCGRFANRIKAGRFELDGQVYELACNEGGRNHLHGGVDNFARRIWTAQADPDGNAVNFQLSSPDGDEGYPGTVLAGCTYKLDDDDFLTIHMTAAATKATPVNLVHHSYWNLDGRGTIDTHRLRLNASHYLPTDKEQIPTGERVPVTNTPMDYQKLKRLNEDGEPLVDNCFVVEESDAPLRDTAELQSSDGRISMLLSSNQPGVQFYTGYKLDVVPSDGEQIGPRSGLCLETEAFPNAPNEPDFPSSILRPGESYEHVMRHHIKRN